MISLKHLQFFLGGFLLADLYLAGKLNSKSILWDVLFVMGCAALLSPIGTLPFLSCWLIFLLCGAAFKGSLWSRVFSNGWLVTIGGMCYTIYMYHFILMSGVIRLTKGWQTGLPWLDYVVQFVVMFAVIVSISAGLFLVFERPFMNRQWPARFSKFLGTLVKRKGLAGS